MVELHWSVAPLSVRLFLIYVSLVLALSILRALKLMWRLFAVRGKRMSVGDLCSESASPDSFAEAAIANHITYEIPQKNSMLQPSHDRSLLGANGNAFEDEKCFSRCGWPIPPLCIKYKLYGPKSPQQNDFSG